MTPEQRISARAKELGFDLCGISRAFTPKRGPEFRKWLDQGMAGTMTYLNRTAERRLDPEKVLPGVRSVISLGQSYFTGFLPDEIRHDHSRGIIASYAWGQDYHDLMGHAIEELAEFVQTLSSDVKTRAYVDTGPVLERDVAESSGLGFIGKNTLLIHPKMGSQLLLGEVMTTLALEPSPLPKQMPSCGTCTRCQDDCPTHAFPSAYVLDSRLCISYLTIEFRGSIPLPLRPKMGNHVFGCDDCQTCCPWVTRFSTPGRQKAYENTFERKAPKLFDLARLSESDFNEFFRGSPVLRPKYEGFLRNVAVAIGNWKSRDACDALAPLLKHDSELVREHAEWAKEALK
ncbi:MAG: tRNA epoxyqueuosine(34) reductase QueG [Calditrichaeota bacterium]|nr:tRNA epoxyqueuosine(34) reductase QueG [Calditrichota bacterium]MCB9365734.1 tRNA epoxyqueuosine(34) reductase QueG [Calditrichota bacterium]